ncbi:kelch repeat-containing protein [Ktedonobacter sp. SOSP1-52]|uniref:kelch repeat-containing protein n=1 Tax=Ktedonobacter sp. SOSP1-52 TaxID=2778366 RepID=UPI00191576E3|nr:kelch repeat-containing protein [Ktedonobacter sp. SOSP1-52]
MRQRGLEREEIRSTQKGMRLHAYSGLVVGLCILGLIALLTACGDPPPAVSQGKATPRVTTPRATAMATPTSNAYSTPAFIEDGAGPASRAVPQFAYDKRHEGLVLFGGKSFTGYLQDTWTWDGHAWTQRHPAASPKPILGASMAYDDATGLVVLFGGSLIGGNQATNETWIWDGTTWVQENPPTSPPPRMNASIAYDAAIGQLVLFGGFATGANSPLNDTWTWDGTTWTQHPGMAPSARMNASMAYDAATHTVVLFGGDDMGAPIPLLTDTWTWDGTAWTQEHPSPSPEVRFTNNGTLYGAYPIQTSMVLDEATQQVTLTLAGSDNPGKQNIQVSWTWDGKNWRQQSLQHLPEQDMCLFYSVAQRTVYAFATSITMTAFNDSLWQWKGHNWQPPTV